MKYIHIHCSNGYSGCEFDEPFALSDNYTEEDIDEMAWDLACDNAETYAYVHFGWENHYSERDWEEYVENYVEMDWHYMTYEEYLTDCQNYNINPKNEY